MRPVLLVLVLALLAGCSQQPQPAATPATPASVLEAAAIEAGVVADPNSTDIVGLYARDTDRVCIVPSATAYRIGVFVDYGDDQACSGSGVVSQAGETLNVNFPTMPGCTFEARFEGDHIVFPAAVPEACERLCQQRASLAALTVDRLSDSTSEASTLRDAKGRLLCGAGD